MLLAKTTWRGCVNHVAAVFSEIAEDQWYSCQPRLKVNGKEYPPSATFEATRSLWMMRISEGDSTSKTGRKGKGKGGL
jgi:hypothetical protein